MIELPPYTVSEASRELAARARLHCARRRTACARRQRLLARGPIRLRRMGVRRGTGAEREESARAPLADPGGPHAD